MDILERIESKIDQLLSKAGEQLLTTNQVLKEFPGLTRKELQRAEIAGEIKAVRIGTSPKKYKRSEIDKWIDSKQQ